MPLRHDRGERNRVIFHVSLTLWVLAHSSAKVSGAGGPPCWSQWGLSVLHAGGVQKKLNMCASTAVYA